MKRYVGTIWGPVNAEDLCPVPDTDWVLTSGMRGPTAPNGRIYAIDRRDLSSTEIYPYSAEAESLDPALFEPHGIDVGAAADGSPVLLVVDHGGGAESVARFAIGLAGDRPTLTHLESVAAPTGTWGNDVAALPGGGFLLSSTTDISDGLEKGMARMGAGEETGSVLRWTPDDGWSTVSGSAINSANGVAVSPDGTVFVAGWRSCCVRRISHGEGPPRVDTVDVDVLVDNITWAPDGALLAAGAYGVTMEQFAEAYFGADPRVVFPYRVLRIDPDTLAVETLLDEPGTAGVATTGLAVGDEVWVGAARDQGIRRYR